MRKPTPKQEAFCQEYIVDKNASRAAEAAKYKTPGQQGYQLLQNPIIKARIKELIGEQQERTQITADMVLLKLWEVANVDLAECYDDEGKLKNIHDIPKHVRQAISGIKVFEEFEGTGRDRKQIGETKELKLWDKMKALELLGKHLKLFTDKLEIDDKSSLAERLKKSRARRAKEQKK